MACWQKNNLHILVINPFGIGDVLFSTPLLRNIRNNFPESFIAYLCNKRVAPLLRNNPCIDEIFVFEKDEWRALWRRSRFAFTKKFFLFLSRIRERKFQIAIDLSLARQYSFFLWLIRVPERIGFDYKDRGVFLTHKIKIDGYHYKPVPVYYLELCRLLNIKPSETKLEIYISPEEEERAKHILKEHGFIPGKDLIIGIIPGGGASWGKEAILKHWSYDKVANLVSNLTLRYNAKIILFGDEKEKVICDGIAAKVKDKPLNLAGKTDLCTLVSLIKQCRLIVCNDGGPLHIAVALGVKTVSIFGPVNEKVYGPYPASFEHIVVTKDVPCRPCYWKFRMPKCEKRICLEEIEPEEVMQAIYRVGGL
ncbi:MAG: glycosyltransferase family 9 protein [Candidatus Omnitrophica bacterium]|nr:glycosyltransferase family 9 protein [Candidatus Omnitrophota bacterium]MCM8793320.1 glycosyltransferase family 9 protein [Candidatus Omnitrophota bacterium]